MSKILLIKPRLLGSEFQYITPPLGLMYIGAALKKAEHKPRIHDCAGDYNDLHVLRRIISNWRPDFIGISIIITELEQTKAIMKIIRETLPDVPVTLGGPWPSANPEEAIKTFGADFVVIGEGELVFPELINAIVNKLPTESIPGTASVVDSKIKVTPGRILTENELNDLPFPAWELLDHKLYAGKPSGALIGRRPYMAIITSRGCPFQCAYCHQTMGKSFRKRSAESVLSEIEELRFKHGFKEFEIIDDCFNFDRERMHVILSGIKNKLNDIKLHFPSGLRADILKSEDMALFKQAGTVSACFAIETSSPRLQKIIRKNLDIEKAVCTIKASVEAGIYSTGFFMIGFPTETFEEASDTVEFAARSPLHRALFHNPIPYPGTKLAEMAENFLKSRNRPNFFRDVKYFNNSMNISAMSDREFHMVFRRAYRRFYLNPKRILRLVISHPEILSLPRYAFSTLMRILPKNIFNYSDK